MIWTVWRGDGNLQPFALAFFGSLHVSPGRAVTGETPRVDDATTMTTSAEVTSIDLPTTSGG